jgi:hypothetical protein
MYIINRRKNIRLIGCEHFIDDDFTFVIYKVQIKVLWFWITIKVIVMMRVRIRMNKMMKVIVIVIVIVMMVIKFISVLMRLVSRTPGHVKLD